jgi:hypothetical protein
MLNLRKRTLRSHASIGVHCEEDSADPQLKEALQAAADLVMTSDKPWHRRFHNLARAYLADMRNSFAAQYQLLKKGGRAICVVANAAHGTAKHRVPVAVDLFLAREAELVGFQIERFDIARRPIRRDAISPFIRETVLVLRKPEA